MLLTGSHKIIVEWTTEMQNLIFDLEDMHKHGTALFDYFALRKQFFVDTLNWDIPHNNRFEMDQYDNPFAYYSLVKKDRKIVGGARVMPTTSCFGEHTYMLKDAADGKLADIPKGIIANPVKNKDTWECTRLVISDDITCPDERAECLKTIVNGIVTIAKRNDCTNLITLSRPSLVRSLNRLGFSAEQMSGRYYEKADNNTYGVLRMDTEYCSLKQKRPTLMTAIANIFTLTRPYITAVAK